MILRRLGNIQKKLVSGIMVQQLLSKVKYKQIFDNQLKYLYRGDITLFQGSVENLDFEKTIIEAEALINEGIIEKITNHLSVAQEGLDYFKKYKVYLLVGFNHVDGTAFVENMPYVYYGLETLRTANLDFLVPHEFNHMVHIEANINRFLKSKFVSVGEFLILEGLGTVFPLTLYNKKINSNTLREALMVREDTFRLMQQHEKEYLDELLQVLDEEITVNLSQEYFMYNSNERINNQPVKSGYYIGSILIINNY